MKKKDSKALLTLLSERPESTKYFKELKEKYEKARHQIIARRNAEMDATHPEAYSFRDEIAASSQIALCRIEKKYAEQKRFYSKVGKIEIKDRYLYLFLTDMVDYNLNPEEKTQLLNAFSKASQAEIVEIANKKHVVYRVRRKIPSRLLSSNKEAELYDWMIDQMRNNAAIAPIIAAEWASHQRDFEML